MIMSKAKATDPFLDYLNNQVRSWKEKIKDIEHDERIYTKRRAAAMQQVCSYRIKLKSLKECKDECNKHLEEAELALQERNTTIKP